MFNSRNFIVYIDQLSVRSPSGLARSDSLEEISGQVKDMYRQFEGNYLVTLKKSANVICEYIDLITNNIARGLA